jgi:acetyl esterase/lipase
VTHGELDTLVPIEEARHFCAALRATSRQPVVYAELPATQHAFELFRSLRSALAINGVERFLLVLYSRFLRANEGRSDTEVSVEAESLGQLAS